MDRKTLVPAVTIALLSCICLMLTVIGGLYAYNTFAGTAEPVAAQSGTDKGPSWSVTSIRVGGEKDLLCVIKEAENPYEAGKLANVLAVYDIRSNNEGKAQMYFVASRLLDYDMMVPHHADEDSKGKSWEPLGVKDAVEKAKKEREKK
jgi:hypothetical protein